MAENEEEDEAMKQTERGWKEFLAGRGVLPHPGPLPLGEGASPSVSCVRDAFNKFGRGRTGSLSQRERAGVRENGLPSRGIVKRASGSGCDWKWRSLGWSSCWSSAFGLFGRGPDKLKLELQRHGSLITDH